MRDDFAMKHTEEEGGEEEKWLELFPYGVTFDSDGFASPERPVMFFRDKEETHTLPVWLSPLDAGILLCQQDKRSISKNPHNLSLKLIKSLGIDLERCVFVDIKGHHQYVDLHFAGASQLTKVRSRADEAISFCLSANVKFYCQLSFIERCRVIDAQLLHQAPFVDSKYGGVRPTYFN